MSAVPESGGVLPASPAEVDFATPRERRADLEAKQAGIAAWLREIDCDALLVLEPENFSWLTSGGTAHGIIDPSALPGLFCTAEGRWVLCANVDSQRLFDEELDCMGFQLKEWPWHWGRQQLLAELCQGKKVACDRPLGDCKVMAEPLRQMRMALSDYERAGCRALGQIVSHALEATGRSIAAAETEREVAAQLCHRLLHRGVQPLVVSVAADGRSRLYRQPNFTATAIHKYCVFAVLARGFGLCVRASRVVSVGPPDPQLRKEHDAASRVTASYIASTWPDALPGQVLASGRRIYQMSGAEHEWLLCPQGYVTGRAPVELPLTPTTDTLFPTGWAITWQASIGAAFSCDTLLITEEGPRVITPAENWPLKRIRIQGNELVRPDILMR